MNMMRKRLISLNLAILMLLSLVLPAGAAELGEPAAVLTAEQSVAQTGEPAVQAEGPDEEPIAIFYTEDHAEYARVDASADGWMPPALPFTLGGGQYLYWLGSYPTEDGVDYYYLDCIPGVGYPALPAKAEFQPISPQSTRGILFSNNGMQNWTDENCFMMRYPPEDDTGEMKINGYQPSDRNGRSFLGWTLTPEPKEDGNYFTGDDPVPGTDKGWVTLYAQWVPEGQTAVYLSGKFYGLANAGTTYMLPAAGNDNTIVTGWQEVTCNTENSSEQLPVTQTTDGGCQVDIPANASELWLYPKYQYVGAAVIDGKTYQFTENETFFSGDGWQLQSLYGGVQLRLNGYHGGAIDLPYTDLVTVTVSLYGDNSITGGTDAPALYSAGDLRFDSRCEANQHTSLTVTVGSGQNAISAKQIQLAAHITLNGGTGATAVSSEAKVLTAHNYSLCDGAGNELTGGYNTVPCLKAMPTYATVTLNGNGGKATDGSEKETLVKTYENGIYAKNLDRLFKKDGALYAGYAVGGRHHIGNSLYINGDGTVDILWAESGYSNFVGFHTEGAIKEKLDYDFGWGAGYLFRDNSKTVIAPSITYQDPVSNGNLVYWYPESNISDPECGHQYLPGETVNEADGTVLRTATAYPNREIVLMANGKTFAENGARVLIRTSLPNVTAADGAELVHWNTKPDGSGTAYGAYADISLRGRTEPLVLYAQWKKPVYVAKVEEPKPNEPQTGGTLTIKPRPTPAPDPGTGTGPEPTEPEKPAPIKETQKVLVGVYRWGMMIAVLQGETDKKGEEIYCTVPKGLDLTGCALKLFVLSEAYAPDRKVEFILLSE